MKNKIEPDCLEWTSGKVRGFYGKEFINLENGQVKLIKIDPLAVYPDHSHPQKAEFAYVVQGQPEFRINQECYSGRHGDFFIFPKNMKHAILNKANEDCVLLVGSIKN